MRPSLTLLVAAGFLFSANSFAQQISQKYMFVVDGSGSMWAEVEGKIKINAAREVMNTLIDDLEDDVEVGLVSYGHRREGACDDIETLIPLGPLDRVAIKSAVNNINPTGKTPLSAAVIKAAEELRYTEEQATVVLVSDGRETCNMDPCAVGNQLERAGIDFTTHVIGFDVAEEDDRAQLRCLAENTGGIFLAASNTDELTAALRRVAADVVTPQRPAPARYLDFPGTVSAAQVFTVKWKDKPEAFNDKVRIMGASNSIRAQIKASEPKNNETKFVAPSDPGTYQVEYWSHADRAVLHREPLVVVPGQFSFEFPNSVSAAQSFTIKWNGTPNVKGDRVSIMAGTKLQSEVKVINAKNNNESTFVAPAEPGSYQVNYWNQANRTVLHSRQLQVTQ